MTKLSCYIFEAVEREPEEFPGDVTFQLCVLEFMTKYLALGKALNFL